MWKWTTTLNPSSRNPSAHLTTVVLSIYVFMNSKRLFFINSQRIALISNTILLYVVSISNIEDIDNWIYMHIYIGYIIYIECIYIWENLKITQSSYCIFSFNNCSAQSRLTLLDRALDRTSNFVLCQLLFCFVQFEKIKL